MIKRLPLQGFNLKTSFAPMLELGVFEEAEKVPFENNFPNWSPINAWYMAECSRLAYADDTKVVEKHLATVGMTNTKFWDIKGTQVFVAWNESTIWLSCTGTELEEGTADILVDLQAIPVKYQNGDAYVHAGFQRALNYVLEKVLRFVNDLLDERNELWITGHSLGAALALEFATYFENNGTYVFGCPRTFSKAGAGLAKGPVYRIVENHDIVTRIPLPPVFRHVGEVYFIDSAGDVIHNPGVWKRTRSRLGGGELTIVWNLVKMIIFKSYGEVILSYLHGHSPFNYSVYMWNNLIKSR